jgi:hypothetical protein
MTHTFTYKVLVDTFVTPWDEGPHVHSWLVVRRASSGSGVRGLGVMSGATKVHTSRLASTPSRPLGLKAFKPKAFRPKAFRP